MKTSLLSLRAFSLAALLIAIALASEQVWADDCRINLSQSRLSKLEQNPGSMTVDQLLALCGSLGLDLTLQVRGTDEPAATPAEW